MSNRKGWLGRISEEGIKEIIWESLRSWLWPLLFTGTTALLGYAQGLPLMYIFLGAIMAFAFVTHGLVKITEWQYIKTPEHKIDFIEPNIGADYDKLDQRKANGVYLGAKLMSHSAFPMEVEMISLITKFDDRVPKQNDIINRVLFVGMRGECFFTGGLIDIKGLDLKGREIEAEVDFVVRYGAPGKRIYTYKKSIEIIFQFDNDGYYKTHVWQDSRKQLAA